MISKEYKQKVAKGESHWLKRKSPVKNFIKALKNNYETIKSLNVLDAGCAQGRDSFEITLNGPNVIGIDYDRNFIVQARKNYKEIKFDQGTIEKLPYESNSFDAVYCVNTLFYTKPEETLPELERVLKSGGIAFITLDKKIVDLDKNEVIHSLDINEALKYFKKSEVISKMYMQRRDYTPFNHKHFYYEIVLRKL